MISEEVKKEIIEDYKNGKSFYRIGKDHNLEGTTVRRIIIKADIPLRHDYKKGGYNCKIPKELLIYWCKKQKRLVTKAELARAFRRKRLSEDYFTDYPELSVYIKNDCPQELASYYDELYNWLRLNDIPFKKKDKCTIGVEIDALLLGEYKGIGLQISIKPYTTSKKIFTQRMTNKFNKAEEHGLQLIFLNKEHFSNLDELKNMLSHIKSK